jgi:1-acyl-sn-glycerol-3-phosphate acyltransferase
MRRALELGALYTFQLLVARPVLRWLVGVRYRRRGRLPDDPCLVVSNHNSHLDAAVLLALFPLRRLHRVHPVAASDYFDQSALRRTFAMLLMNGIPIRRKPVRGEDALEPVVSALRGGQSLIFFPEGSRGEAGVVSRFRPGVGKLLQALPGLTVLPVYLSGPERIWPRGKLPVPLSVDVHVGRPRVFAVDRDARTIAEQVREAVLALAPPPPPVPGEHPEPPLRIALAGVDPARQAAAARAIALRLGLHGTVLALGETPYEVRGGVLRETSLPLSAVPGARLWLGLLTRLARTAPGHRGSRFADLAERARASELLERGRGVRFVVEERSALVELPACALARPGTALAARDLVAYLGPKRVPFAAWLEMWRHAPEVFLFNVLDLARPPLPDLLVRLVVSADATAGPAVPSASAGIERLERAIDTVAELLARRRVTIVTVDADTHDADAIAEHVATQALALAPPGLKNEGRAG